MGRREADAAAGPLRCIACAEAAPPTERFCPRCGTPLVHAPGTQAPVSAARERARKVKPQYGEGRLVHVAAARNQPEGEFIQGLLLEEGIPSLMRRARGFDVPDFLASGPRDILVPQSGVAAARDVLGTPAGQAPPHREPWVRALAMALAVLVLALVAAGVLSAIVG